MAFCENCGAELKSGVAFCTMCGTKVKGNQAQPVVTKTVTTKKPMNKMFIGVAAVAVAVIAIIAFVATRGVKLDIEECTEVTTKGYDGNGKISIDIDEDALSWELMDAEYISAEQEASFLDSIEVVASEDEGLSNGQEIKLAVKYNEKLAKKLKVKVKKTEWKYKVENLDEVEEIDPFDYIEVSFKGIAPNGTASITTKDISSTYGCLSYQADTVKGLSNGDEITIECTSDEKTYIDRGYKFTETSKKYTVEGLQAYVAAPSDIDKKTMETLQTEAADIVSAYLEEQSTDRQVNNSGLNYEGSLVLMRKEFSGWSSNNEVILIYTTTVSGGEDGDIDPTVIYYPIRFENVVINEDGEIEYEKVGKAYMADTNIEFGWGFRLEGYEDSSKMASDLAKSKTDQFTYEVSKELKELFE